ncbi:MAG: DUF1269 domain-containing protein [Butyrivibrio sp.]|nr:DUF1269 domain-containing protein [Butyrivibrio sp.]
MAQNIVVGLFEVESEGFQAMSELKQNPGDDKSFITQAVLVKKENGTIKTLEAFDTGANTLDDTAIGGVVGSLFGILGGPIGVLLGASYGSLIGAVLDTTDAVDDASLIEQIAGKLDDDDVAIIALSSEENEAILDEKLSKFKTIIARFDAAVVAVEVEEAQKMAEEMARQARKELREDKKKEIEQKVAEKRSEIAANVEAVKTKLAPEG